MEGRNLSHVVYRHPYPKLKILVSQVPFTFLMKGGLLGFPVVRKIISLALPKSQILLRELLI